MPWLLRQGEVLASLTLTSTHSALVRHLSGRDHFDGALVVHPARTAHTFGVRFPLDLAYLDEDLTVLSTTRLAPFRVALPRRGASSLLEAEAGAFDRWRLVPGDCLEIKD